MEEFEKMLTTNRLNRRADNTIFPYNSWILLYGKPASGKTRYILSQLPKNRSVLYIDFDGGITTSYIKDYNAEHIHLFDKNYISEFLTYDILIEIINNNYFDIIVIDTIGNSDKISLDYIQYKRQLFTFLNRLDTTACMIFVDQIREDMHKRVLNFSSKLLKRYCDKVIYIEKHNVKGNYIKGILRIEKNTVDVEYDKEKEITI